MLILRTLSQKQQIFTSSFEHLEQHDRVFIINQLPKFGKVLNLIFLSECCYSDMRGEQCMLYLESNQVLGFSKYTIQSLDMEKKFEIEIK